jgi:hypothetical protein
VSVLCGDGKLWAAMPDKPLIGDGGALLDDWGKMRHVGDHG